MEVFKNIFDNLGITEFARPSLGISDILDILIVAYIIYKIIFCIAINSPLSHQTLKTPFTI